jgi:TPR repeat protein
VIERYYSKRSANTQTPTTKKPIVRHIITALLALVFTAAQAGDFEDGAAAFKRKDYATALTKWRSAAQEGDLNAQTMLGSMYYEGKGTAQDYKEAARWFQLAAQRGVADAQLNLGAMYDRGQGVVQD